MSCGHMFSPLNVSTGVPPETPEQLIADSLRLVGSTTVCGTFYGFMTACAGACVYQTLNSHKPLRRSGLRTAFQLLFVGLLWLCGTIVVVALAQDVDTVYVRNRLLEPGPHAYNDFKLIPVFVLDTAYYVSMVLADGVMVWRFKVIWHNWPLRRTLFALVSLIYALSIVASLVSVIVASLDCSDCPKILGQSIELGFTSSVALNVLTTALMASKLYRFRNRIIKAPMSDSSPSLYANIASMLAESCALYTIFSVLFIVLNTMHHAGKYVVFGALSQVQVIAPLLVVLRLSSGKAWREEQDACVGAALEGQNTLVFSRTVLASAIAVEGGELGGGETVDRMTGGNAGQSEVASPMNGGAMQRDHNRGMTHGSTTCLESEGHEMRSMGCDTSETLGVGGPSNGGCGEGLVGKSRLFASL
ncbi:hypothetical protein CONPUDRAFT_144291 [Coniophora puteana RWD-64-598 SS2]|uniref:Uncharacterized protein n=1 Tax=Coniophora puteana (strain RWD-64-598) TaxID=741705 RepID=A0A5M3MSR4_CONPW|nr:uncharacterized protein CONPUDRAFT_144291 [Coniophora puteana RWD-64-598 SS2]EIW81571.1 hypothetical protein CONPUDRAFT_144291 [Coniophora puteana RWD-64-598 SS2]